MKVSKLSASQTVFHVQQATAKSKRVPILFTFVRSNLDHNALPRPRIFREPVAFHCLAHTYLCAKLFSLTISH